VVHVAQVGNANEPQSLDSPTAMHATSSSNLWVGGDFSDRGGGGTGAKIHQWNGEQWFNRSPTPGPDINTGINDIWVVSDQEVWAVGQNSTVLRTTDGGTNWEDMDPFAGTVHVQAVSAPAQNFVWITASNGEIRYYDGYEWIQVVPPLGGGVPFLSVHGSSPAMPGSSAWGNGRST